jgi:hypothetical protein
LTHLLACRQALIEVSAFVIANQLAVKRGEQVADKHERNRAFYPVASERELLLDPELRERVRVTEHPMSQAYPTLDGHEPTSEQMSAAGAEWRSPSPS